jgi:septal ring factor EnvC (AmiA/AmiB activator)
MWFVAIVFSFSSSFESYANEVVDDIVATKSDISANEEAARAMMSKLYTINTRMKTMSRSRDKANNKLIDVENRAQNLARDQAQLEGIIQSQRMALSKRLRTLYKVGENQLMRLVFSATSSQDLYQNMKYMRLMTEQDYKLIKKHQMNLTKLRDTKTRLQLEVKKLVSVRNLLHRQEVALEKEQESKARVLSHLNQKRQEKISDLKAMRKKLTEESLGLLDFSFSENKGKLNHPVGVEHKTRGFGLVEHPEYAYRLSHKGIMYEGAGYVRSIFQGKIAFVGSILGFGNTLIIDHGDHYYSVYANLGQTQFKKGDSITGNQVISSFSDRVYFEIRHFSDAIDPKYWLKEEV